MNKKLPDLVPSTAARLLTDSTILMTIIFTPVCAPRGQKTVLPVIANPATDTANAMAETASATSAAQLDTIVGTIRRIDLEGGFWGLFSDDGRKYDPTGSLPRAAQQEGARVRIIAAKRTGVATFRMWGTVIDIVSYEQLGDTVK